MEVLKSTKFWIVISLIVVVVGGGFGIFRYRQLTGELAKVKGTQTNQAAAEEVKKIVASVGKLMELPQGEEPTVATVTDVDKLKDQPFFQRAKNDDKVLIYTSEKRAILYRPSTNKIIDVAPVNLSQQSTPSGQTQANQNQSVTVALYNGTSTSGMVRRYETELRAKLPNATVVVRDNAVNTNTPRTILIDVVGNKTNAARQLSQLLGISAGVLPAGEKAPTADFLIIVGNDKAGNESVTPTPAGARTSEGVTPASTAGPKP